MNTNTVLCCITFVYPTNVLFVIERFLIVRLLIYGCWSTFNGHMYNVVVISYHLTWVIISITFLQLFPAIICNYINYIHYYISGIFTIIFIFHAIRFSNYQHYLQFGRPIIKQILCYFYGPKLNCPCYSRSC